MECCNHKKCTGRDWCHMKTGNLDVGVQSHHKDHICLRIQRKNRKGNTFKTPVYIYSCAHDGYHTFWEKENRAARYELQRDAKVLKPLHHKRQKSRIEGGQLQWPSRSKKAKVRATGDVSKVVEFHCWRQRMMAYLYTFIERGECYKLLAEITPDTPPSSISTHQTILATIKS